MRPPLQPVAPSIDDPIELLQACHDKVRHFAALSLRLRNHLAKQGIDTQAQEAATSILRYFDLAAPLHHDDEEQDLFPALRTLGSAKLCARIDQVESEHEDLNRLWQVVRPWLHAIASGHACDAPTEVEIFATSYPAHADREEADIYPAAAALQAIQVKLISEAMVMRRTLGQAP